MCLGVYVLQPEAVSDDEEGRKAFMEKQSEFFLLSFV